ncbi:MAG: hypothetical protein ACRED1_01875, partial [Limisphaerales bacterium]
MALTLITALGLSLAAKIGGVKNLWPLLPAGLAGSVFAWCDRRNEAREGAVEVAGAVTFSLLPAAFATLAGWSAPAALALAAMMLMRSVPTVLTVRANLRIKKGRAVSTVPALFAAGAGLILTAWLIWLRLAPWPALIFASAFMARTIWLLGWRPRLR